MEVETKGTLRSMERKVDGLETESNKMKETKENMTKTSQEVHPLKTIIEELQKEMNTLKIKTRSTETELRKENNKMKEDMAEIRQKIHPLKTINEDLLKEINTMKTKTRSTATELRKENNKMKEDMAEIIQKVH